ncbi:Zinc finger protein [Pseudolycoriella hygida]|uniref:Zinc finger protein n=1 Tax=Pseudolycoriella hygida TaxID=35572 RepID=A0A9Q0S9B9_9DIPT|nr:Zinc finger protein [Pseudolycoriella hygida]
MECETINESGKIYRNSNGIFCFVCVHCGNYFENVNETLEHIESHFTDGTISHNDETAVTEGKPLKLADALEFISTDSRSDFKIEDGAMRDQPENWVKPATKNPSFTSVDSRIKCSHCSECFSSQLILALHSDVQHPNQPIEGVQTSDIQCDRCLIEFDTLSKLEEHLNQDHSMEVTIDLRVDHVSELQEPEECLKCKFCRRSFKATHLLKRHLQRSSCKDEFVIPIEVAEFAFNCDICGHGFHKKFRLINHMTQHHSEKEERCKYCNQRYVLETTLRKHEKFECLQRPNLNDDEMRKLAIEKEEVKKSWGGCRVPKNVEGSKMFHCEFCSKIYDTHYKLKQHLLSHSNLREFKCDLCDCAYNTKPRLRRHYIYNHTDHPTFDCEVCGWKFREKNNLKRHMRLHNGDYQASCQICDKKFTANCHLKYHMNTAHSTETPYQCDVCGKSFNSTSKMNAHRRRHIKETLPCEQCGKVFGSRNRLYTHKKTHSEERNIICKVCGKSFKTAVVLRQHMYLHKGKIFSCNFCPMTFAQSSGRRTHEKLRHNIL